MAVFTIFDRPGRADEAPRIVPEHFSWFAALLPPVYAFSHRMWLSLIVYLLVLGGIIGASFVIGDMAARLVYILFALWIGFEAPMLRRRSLLSKGYLQRADLVAQDADLAVVEWFRIKERSA